MGKDEPLTLREEIFPLSGQSLGAPRVFDQQLSLSYISLMPLSNGGRKSEIRFKGHICSRGMGVASAPLPRVNKSLYFQPLGHYGGS